MHIKKWLFLCIGTCLALAIAGLADAAPVTFSFFIQATEGSASGSFTGTDSNADNQLSATELSAFQVTATGTAATGGPIGPLTLPTVTFGAFSFNLLTDSLAFDVSNSLDSRVSCFTCAPAGTLVVQLGTVISGRPISAVTIIQRSTVPEPTTVALLSLGVIGLVASRRRKPS